MRQTEREQLWQTRHRLDALQVSLEQWPPLSVDENRCRKYRLDLVCEMMGLMNSALEEEPEPVSEPLPLRSGHEDYTNKQIDSLEKRFVGHQRLHEEAEVSWRALTEQVKELFLRVDALEVNVKLHEKDKVTWRNLTKQTKRIFTRVNSLEGEARGHQKRHNLDEVDRLQLLARVDALEGDGPTPDEQDRVKRLVQDGHSYHCAMRIVHGDGNCEAACGVVPACPTCDLSVPGQKCGCVVVPDDTSHCPQNCKCREIDPYEHGECATCETPLRPTAWGCLDCGKPSVHSVHDDIVAEGLVGGAGGSVSTPASCWTTPPEGEAGGRHDGSIMPCIDEPLCPDDILIKPKPGTLLYVIAQAQADGGRRAMHSSCGDDWQPLASLLNRSWPNEAWVWYPDEAIPGKGCLDRNGGCTFIKVMPALTRRDALTAAMDALGPDAEWDTVEVWSSAVMAGWVVESRTTHENPRRWSVHVDSITGKAEVQP